MKSDCPILNNPSRYNFSNNWSCNGFFCVNDKIYNFNPTVRDFYLLLRGSIEKDNVMQNYVLMKHELTFDSTQEFDDFFGYVFGDESLRFCQVDTDDKRVVFDYFMDADVIYSDFVKTYPHLVKSPTDIEEMPYFQFKMLFDNRNMTLNDRIDIRTAETQPIDLKASAERISETKSRNKKITEAQMKYGISNPLNLAKKFD